MYVRSWLFFWCVAVAGWRATPPAQAQCLPLQLLDQGIAAGRVTADSLDLLLEPGEWQRHRGPNPYWTYRTPGEADTPEAQAQAWVGLRRSNQQAHYDLVYKTRQHACIAQLRAQLRHRAKLKSELITCVQCEGERLVGNGYTITIFNQEDSYLAKRTSYPYVLVIRRTASAREPGPTLPEASSQVAGEN